MWKQKKNKKNNSSKKRSSMKRSSMKRLVVVSHLRQQQSASLWLGLMVTLLVGKTW